MIEKLESVKKEYKDLGKKLSDPSIISDTQKLQEIAKRRNALETTVKLYEKYTKIESDIMEAKKMIVQKDMKNFAQTELEKLRKEKKELEKELEIALLPKDPDDSKDVIMEIRAGAGGNEAALFAADLFRMYSRYAEKKSWKIDIMNSSRLGIGGFKEIIFSISGNNVYKKLKYESGVHRVQRVPETESSGRIHTSTATVAVLPEAEEVEIDISTKDLRIDVFRSSGPGGQSVNTTDSAVRITHIPTGIVVSCQDEKSQLKNKEKALKILRSRLKAQKEEEEIKKRGETRMIQIGTGDRSEKIRTYNFPQNRVTDHRISFSSHDIESIMQGNLDEFIKKLRQADQSKKMESLK
jgi:peptide chain release factor 1